MNESTGPSREAIAHWLAATKERMTSVKQELEPLARELESLQEQRSLLLDLARTMETDDERKQRNESHIRKSPRFSGRKEPIRNRVHREVVEVLGEIGLPVHINDLAEEYEKRGYKIPGQGKPANISVHLSGWDDIVSPERGMYALAKSTNADEVKQ
jgi:transposase